ncbi:MAG: MFS transporter, partial [Deltaproteobacteria bacterium]
FLMAVHSTFFGPAKYGIVPEMMPDKDLSRANGLLEMSMFLAIILGTSIGTIMYSAWKDRLVLIGLCLVVIAVAGTVLSFGITRVADSGARKRFDMNPWGEIGQGLRRLYSDRLLLLTVSALTYFWFLGSLLQMTILLLGKEVMHLPDLWIGILITSLAAGIGIGSITAGRLSGDKVEPGLVPLGSIGMGVFAILLSFSSFSYPRTAAAMMMLGFSGGLFIVPLNALLQQKSGSEEKGRIIGTNNFVNTIGILLASGVLWIMRDYFDVEADRIILIFGVLTLVCTVFLMRALPEFLVRFTLWMLTHTVYRIRIAGQENVPFKGGALLVCNHMSFADGLLVGASVQRFIRFMVYQRFYGLKPIRWLLVLMKAIPVADGGRREIVKTLGRAREELKGGHVVCIFAEGEISRTGNLLPFKRGFEKIVEGLDVPVIPVHLDRVWGSVFSFKDGRFFWKWPSHFPYPVTVSFGKPLKSTAGADEVRRAVMELGSEAVEYRRSNADLLHLRFIKAARRRYFSLCMADSTGRELTWGKTLTASLLLSRRLRKNGGMGTMTGLLLPPSTAGAIANAAVLLAGGVPVNLNFTAGMDDVARAVKKCSASRIITSRAFISKAGLETMNGMVFLEDMFSGISRVEKALTAAAAFLLPSRALFSIYSRSGNDPHKPAAVIFTSGSASEPRGVMLSHHNIISNVEGFSQIFNVNGKDTVMGALPFFHSFGFTGTIWFPLINGLRAVYHSNPLDAKTIGGLVRKYGATIIIGAPTFYSAYAKKCPSEDFSSIRYAIAGAERLRPDTAEEFRKKFGIELLEGYGCTEMSPVISVNIPDVEHDEIRQTGFKAGTVGHPIPGVTVKVADPETGADIPAGGEGLLLVKGPGLMLGYLAEPELTGEAVKNGWYSTGDIASIGEDGFIKIVGRVSRFSKLAGEMVPHVRVEEVLSKALRGSDCVVVSLPDAHKGEKMIAFHTRSGLSAAEVWEAVSSSGLPRLWIPRRENIRFIDSIPLTAAGKVDLRRLKSMAMQLAGG